MVKYIKNFEEVEVCDYNIDAAVKVFEDTTNYEDKTWLRTTIYQFDNDNFMRFFDAGDGSMRHGEKMIKTRYAFLESRDEIFQLLIKDGFDAEVIVLNEVPSSKERRRVKGIVRETDFITTNPKVVFLQKYKSIG